jgi:hypothetical protein
VIKKTGQFNLLFPLHVVIRVGLIQDVCPSGTTMQTSVGGLTVGETAVIGSNDCDNTPLQFPGISHWFVSAQQTVPGGQESERRLETTKQKRPT